MSVSNYFKELISSHELLANLTLREIRGQYKQTFFGQLWSLFNPFATMLVYWIVFGFFLRVSPPAGNPSVLNVFPVWLICGLLPWAFFARVIQQGMTSLVVNSGLIQKVYFPRTVLPLSYAGSAAYNWLFEMGFLLVVLLICGANPLPFLPLLLVTMLLLAIFAAGLSMLLSIANVYFRDTQHFVSILLQIWLYMTPVVYPITLVQEQSNSIGKLWGSPFTLLDIYQVNPMTEFVGIFRDLLYNNALPSWGAFLYAFVASLLVFMIGLALYRNKEKGLAEAL